MNADVHALTGAYVLDAVSEDERAVFERHLGECDACRQEVAELRETATRLGTAVAATPPPRLRPAVMARLRDVRQLPPEGAVVPLRRPPRSWALRLSVAAAAVLLLVSGVLGELLVRAQNSTEDARNQAEAMAGILRAGDVQVVRQGDAASGRMTAVMSLSADRMLLLADGLPPAPSGHDYQAWTIAGDGARSAGLIVPRDGRANLEVTGIDSAKEVGITVEPGGGSPKPTTPTIMTFDLT